MWDAIVIGTGGVGSFALRALARRGLKVLGLERFELGHDRGSSHGATRVFRHAYFEHADYVPLLAQSTRVFRELQSDRATPLVETCGTLLIGHEDSDVLAAAHEAARIHGIPVESIPREAFAERYPLFDLPSDNKGLLELGGGFVRPEDAVRSAAEDAQAHGAELHTGVHVTGIHESADHVRIETSEGTHTAARLIVTAGAWTAQLLPEIASYLRVTRQVQGWIEPQDPAPIHHERLPAWFVVRAEGPPLYGIPADPLASGKPRAKVALHGRTEPADPNAPRRPIDDADREQLLAAVRTWLPHLGDNLVEAKTCLYTVTADEHFLVDQAPGRERVWYVAGLSGHGFKMTPALGQAVAELALDGAAQLQVDFLKSDRFEA